MPRDVTIRTNQARFDQVAWILVNKVRSNEFPFNIMWLPQNATPDEFKKDPLVLSRAIFFANMFMRGQVQSNYIYGQAMKLLMAHPELMDPAFMSQEWVDVQYVFDRVAPFIKYRLFEMPRLILDAFRRLQEDWGGDPRKLIEGIEDSDELSGTNSHELHLRMVNIESIPKKRRHERQGRGIIGVRPKIANLFAYFMRALQLMEHAKTTEVAFDFHAERIFTVTGAIILGGTDPVRFEDVTRIGSKMAETFCLNHNVPTNELADGFWWFSKAMCARAPGNRTLGRSKRPDHNKSQRHTIDYKPQPRVKVTLKFYQPDWSKQRDVRAYELSCGKCALEHLCTLNLSSGFYGEEGTLRTQPRTKPLPHLFGHGNLHHQTSGKPKLPDEVPSDEPLEPMPVLVGLDISREQRKPDPTLDL
jgi:hypothetical protein